MLWSDVFLAYILEAFVIIFVFQETCGSRSLLVSIYVVVFLKLISNIDLRKLYYAYRKIVVKNIFMVRCFCLACVKKIPCRTMTI